MSRYRRPARPSPLSSPLPGHALEAGQSVAQVDAVERRQPVEAILLLPHHEIATAIVVDIHEDDGATTTDGLGGAACVAGKPTAGRARIEPQLVALHAQAAAAAEAAVQVRQSAAVDISCRATVTITPTERR